jgi:hypothetical protein
VVGTPGVKGPGLLVGSAVVDVQDLLVGGEREPVRLVERIRDDREVRGPRIEPVDVVADLRLRPKALEMAIARIREPEVPSLLATTSFGEFSRRPPHSSTSVPTAPFAVAVRVTAACCDRVPCSQATRRPSRSRAMPFATLAFSRTVEMRSGSSGKRSPSRAIRATRTLGKPGAGTWPGLGRLVK